MKKFRYNMENILQVKLRLEDQAKLAYSNARLRLNIEEEKLQVLNGRKLSYEDELRSLKSSKLDLIKIRQGEEAIDIIKQKIKEQQIVVRNAENRLEVVRIRLNNAMVERKTQEKLKEKAWGEYLLEFDAEERKEIDELNSFNFKTAALSEEDI